MKYPIGVTWIVALFFAFVSASASEPLIHLNGSDFEGGAKDSFGSTFYGKQNVNCIYARPTGTHSVMKAHFELGSIPQGAVFLCLQARDHDGTGRCHIEIRLNDTVLFEGPNPFPKNRWHVESIPIGDGVLTSGKNELMIANRETQGPLGLPPWFMVAKCWIRSGAACAGVRSRIEKDFFVTLPDAHEPDFAGLPDRKGKSAFRIRGIKGWRWTPEQYLEEIPFLAKFKMNFLMNCYLSMFAMDKAAWNSGNANLWWEPLPEAKKRAYEKIVRSCREHDVEFCFAMNPNLLSSRPLDYDRQADVDALWQHYEWMVGLGVNWFSVCLDDISKGIDAAGQAKVVNELFRRLRAQNPKAQMIFCPTYYWGDGKGEHQRPYLNTLASQLDDDVYLFWTGEQSVGRITRHVAESFKGIAKHRLVLWDNYPVNDDHPTMHLGPVVGRDPDLCKVIDGYMSNSMCRQNQINRIPLFTCAAYAGSPLTYDPAHSIAQAIMSAGENHEQRLVLKDLVEAYPGMILHNAGVVFNPVRVQFDRLASEPHSRYIVENYVHHLSGIATRMERAFPNAYRSARKTLNDDIAWMNRKLANKYGP